MTKIKMEKVKCCKCNAESDQVFVYSVNYMLGDKKSNDNLRKHQQECPYCGYKASHNDE